MYTQSHAFCLQLLICIHPSFPFQCLSPVTSHRVTPGPLALASIHLHQMYFPCQSTKSYKAWTYHLRFPMTSASQPNILALSPVTCLHHIFIPRSLSLLLFMPSLLSEISSLAISPDLNSSGLISNALPPTNPFFSGTPSGRSFLLWALQSTEIYTGGHYLMLPCIKISPFCHTAIPLKADTFLCLMHLFLFQHSTRNTSGLQSALGQWTHVFRFQPYCTWTISLPW